MLQSIRIEGFKSYRSAELPLAELTVLIGANASGKSNLNRFLKNPPTQRLCSRKTTPLM